MPDHKVWVDDPSGNEGSTRIEADKRLTPGANCRSYSRRAEGLALHLQILDNDLCT